MQIEDVIEKKANLVLNRKEKNMGDALGLEYKVISKNEVSAEMPVNENTIQPFGILHGGASVALAETLASIGGWLNADEGKTAVGVEINANHIRSVKKGGRVTGKATPVKIGRSIQIWEIRITNERDKLVCMSRCTLAIVEMK